jgi:Polyphosphate kinase 2 (PPK2)
VMLQRSHIPEAPWWVVQAVDKKRARLNCIHHLLSQVPYHEIEHPAITLPERVYNNEYIRQPVPGNMIVPEVYCTGWSNEKSAARAALFFGGAFQAAILCRLKSTAARSKHVQEHPIQPRRQCNRNGQR